MMRPLARRTKAWRSRTRVAGVLRARRNTRHSIRATSATAFIGTTAAAAAVFLPPRRRWSIPASSVLLPNLHCSSRTWLRRYDLLAAARGRQCTLGQEPAPREELVRGNAMAASYQAYRHARLERLLDDPDFLRRCPAPTALNRRDNLNSIRRIGHRHGCMPLANWETGSGRFDQDRQTRQIEARHSSD